MKFHAELELGGGLAVAADAEISRGHAPHGTVLAVEDLGGCEAGEDLDP